MIEFQHGGSGVMKKMTEGKIVPQLFLFSLPLVLGSILQLTYNLFDYIIMGWFSADPINSQAALSIAGPIFNIFISLISGLCVGLAIHTSQLFGTGDECSLKKQFTSCLIVFGIFSLGLTVLFNLLLTPIMAISNVTDPTLKYDAMVYLGITSLGLVFSFLYNMYASYLRALGDSLASLIFLAISCVLNIVLNIVFVAQFKMEIAGVALSTLISQVLSAILIMIYGKLRYKTLLVLSPKEYVIDGPLLKISTGYAVASAMQQIVLYVGKYAISTQINKFDAYYIAAFGGASKLDDFVFAPGQNFGHATSIFVAQNRGAGNKERCKRGYLTGFGLNLIYGVLISITIALLRRPVFNLFIGSDVVDRELVVDSGVLYLSIMCFLYILPCITNSIQSFFRGMGKLNMVFYSTTVQIVVRVVSMFVLVACSVGPMQSAAFSTMIGWIAMICFEAPFLVYNWKHFDKFLPKIE